MHLTPSTYDPLRSSISVYDAPDQPFAFGVLESLPIATESDPATRTGWSVRVSGTSEHLLQLWEADTYWSGELVPSLDELIQREREVAPRGRGPWVYILSACPEAGPSTVASDSAACSATTTEQRRAIGSGSSERLLPARGLPKPRRPLPDRSAASSIGGRSA